MKLEKDTVTICGFVAIFVLVLLIVAPPVLRGFLGTEDSGNSNALLSSVYERLECEKLENYTVYNLNRKITTIYKNNEVNNILFLYDVAFLTNDSDISLSDVYIDEYSILKQVTNALVVEEDNQFKIELNYEKYNYRYDQFLNKYSNSVARQKQYYTNNGYECKIIK